MARALRAVVEEEEETFSPAAEAEQAWQKFVEDLLGCQDAWEKFRSAMAGVKSVEELSLPAQRLLAISSVRSDFFTAMPRMLDTARRNGGLDYFLITKMEEEE